MKKKYIAPSIVVIKPKAERLMNQGSVVDKYGNNNASIGYDDTGGETGYDDTVWGDAKDNTWTDWEE